MKVGTAFPSTYLKADDLEDRDWPVTIKEVKMELVGMPGDQSEKLTLMFDELDKGIVCNKTNAGVIEKMYGAETDDWIGKKITLWPNHDVEFKGEIVSAIRVRSRPVAAIKQPQKKTAEREVIEDLQMDVDIIPEEPGAMDGEPEDSWAVGLITKLTQKKSKTGKLSYGIQLDNDHFYYGDESVLLAAKKIGPKVKAKIEFVASAEGNAVTSIKKA